MRKVFLNITTGLLLHFIVLHIHAAHAQTIAPLNDTPGKTMGSDFNGDGIHDFLIGAHFNDDGGGNAGAAYVFFGATNLTGTKDLGGGQSADVSLIGKTNTRLGRAVSSVGDVNGDGIDDFMVGAYFDNTGGSNAGAAYIIFGSTNLNGTYNMIGSILSPDITIFGKAANDYLGKQIAPAGDINGDGFDDVLISALGNDDAGGAAGAAYVFFGSASMNSTISLGGVLSADITFLGKAGDNLGYDVAGAGDVNGDGFDDLIIGAFYNDDSANNSGAAYIIFGSKNLNGTKSFGGGQSADVSILGRGINDNLGRSVAGIGDVNGDGFDDVMAGAFRYGGTNKGEAYVIFGASNLSGTKNLATTASADVTIKGKADNDLLGIYVASAGDINDDGFFDFIIGADRNDGSAGAAYIIFGSSTLSGTKDTANADQDVTFLGKPGTSFLGVSTSTVGDVNADGFSDILVSAYANDSEGTNKGAVYLFFGSSSISGTKSLGGGQSADMTIVGKADSDFLGKSIGGGRHNRGP